MTRHAGCVVTISELLKSLQVQLWWNSPLLQLTSLAAARLSFSISFLLLPSLVAPCCSIDYWLCQKLKRSKSLCRSVVHFFFLDWGRHLLLEAVKMDTRDFSIEMWACQPPMRSTYRTNETDATSQRQRLMALGEDVLFWLERGGFVGADFAAHSSSAVAESRLDIWRGRQLLSSADKLRGGRERLRPEKK